MFLEIFWMGFMAMFPFCLLVAFATNYVGFEFYARVIRSISPHSLLGQLLLILLGGIGTDVAFYWASVTGNFLIFLAYNIAREVKGMR
jgi:hypothetical protein